MNPKAFAKANADNTLPRACWDCKSTEFKRVYGEQNCPSCGSLHIATSDGCCWPSTGMGAQSAAGHERFLQTPERKRKLRHRAVRISIPGPYFITVAGKQIGWQPRTVTVFYDKVVVSQMDVFDNGRKANWYPLRIEIKNWRPVITRKNRSSLKGMAKDAKYVRTELFRPSKD
jgi:hypothetical protein